MADNKGVCWAVRNINQPDIIRIYADKPKKHVDGIHVGKQYLGISCSDKWPGSDIKLGTYTKVKFSVEIVEEEQ